MVVKAAGAKSGTRQHSDITIRDRRASAEKREGSNFYNTSTSTAPAAWMLSFGQNSTGIAVTRQTAFLIPEVWAAVLHICTARAKCPTLVLRRDGNNRVVDTAHPAYRLLRYKPNAHQRSYDFDFQLTMHLLIFSNAFAMIKFNGRGEPIALIPVMPEHVIVFDVPEGRFYQATIYYTNGKYETFYLDDSEMIHWKLMPYDGVMGMSLIDKARESLGQILAMQAYSGSFYRNSARPDMVITHPHSLNEGARVKLAEGWKNDFGGADKSRGVAVLDEGMDVKLLAGDAQKNQEVEMRQQAVRAIANYFGLPSSILGDVTNNTYKSLEQTALAAKTGCYDGIIINFDEGFTEKLISTKEQLEGTHEIETDTERLLVVDYATRATALSALAGPNTQIITQDDARRKIGLNARGGTADELPPPPQGNVVDTKKTATSSVDDSTDEEPADTKTRNAILDLYELAAQRASLRIGTKLAKAHAAGGLIAAFVALPGERDAYAKMIEPEQRAVSAIAEKCIAAASTERIFNGYYEAITRAAAMSPAEFADEIKTRGEAVAMEIANHAKGILFAHA